VFISFIHVQADREYHYIAWIVGLDRDGPGAKDLSKGASMSAETAYTFCLVYCLSLGLRHSFGRTVMPSYSDSMQHRPFHFISSHSIEHSIAS
jgi:hypothetical protein